MGETAPREGQGRQAGRYVSFCGEAMGFSRVRAESLFRYIREREGLMTSPGSALKTVPRK